MGMNELGPNGNFYYTHHHHHHHPSIHPSIPHGQLVAVVDSLWLWPEAELQKRRGERLRW
jgi:hypothetical protein